MNDAKKYYEAVTKTITEKMSMSIFLKRLCVVTYNSVVYNSVIIFLILIA